MELNDETAKRINCLTMDHEVLTRAGWKYYDQITRSDELFTLIEPEVNKDRYSVTFQSPLERYCYEDKVRLYNIKNNMIDTTVTCGHHLLCCGETDYGWDRLFVNKLFTVRELIVELRKCKDRSIRHDQDIWIGEQLLLADNTSWSLSKYSEGDEMTCDIDITIDDITGPYEQRSCVFGFTMPNETFYVRRNGHEYWSGNSS
jgi:hypothetical protein